MGQCYSPIGADECGKGTNKGAVSTYNPQECARYAQKHVVTTKGCCAAYAKAAMVALKGGRMNNNYQTRLNACHVSNWMPFWGFKPIWSGDTKEVENFTPLDGDVLIAAGWSEHKYGHIQIYNNGHWIADFDYKSRAGVYGDGHNLWVIYRK